MPVPGLPNAQAGAGNALILGVSENNVDVFARLGSPSDVFVGSVYVAPSITIGSASSANPAMSFIGFAAGSHFQVVNEGTISGAGGNGGNGGNGLGTPPTDVGAGGGGGAGSVPGTGGSAAAPATAGANGTALLGGAHGTSGVGAAPFLMTTEGEDGGDAIEISGITLSIANATGNIFGGGGGGVGGFEPNPTLADGSNGGGIGEDCEHIAFLASGFAGYAIRGAGATFVSGGSPPNVKGIVET